jgi:Insertion element 4 transposase N-terminal/Transposase DDE domain
MSRGWASPRGRVLARAGIGVLTWVIPPDLVDEAVGGGLAREVRLRAVPARLGAYFTLACCLLSGKPYLEVMRQVTEGLEAALAGVGWRVPSSTALARARARLGERPLESLFRLLCSALSPGREAWSHVGGLLVVAVDGTTVSAAASPRNAAAFGRPGAPRPRRAAGQHEDEEEDGGAGQGTYPQLRLVALVACGTRALLDAAMGPSRGKGSGERALARSLLGSMRPGMLVLADRNFYSFDLWKEAAGTGAGLLWRVKSSLRLPVVRELPDGSWIAHVNDPRAVQARLRKNGVRRRRGSKLGPEAGPLPGITVRVIEYLLTITTSDGATRTERYRHITTLTDWRAFPAAQLAATYAQRWAIETTYRECKAYLRGPGRALRGKDPALARQELWAYLATYQAIRLIIVRAAAGAGLDPDQISFTATLNAIQRTLHATTSHAAALTAIETEILSCLVPCRPGRVFPRAATSSSSPASTRHARQGPLPQRAQYATTITTPARTTQTTTDQPRHPPKRPASPP